MIQDLTYGPLTKRKLTEETCQKWGYGTGSYKGKDVQVANYRSTDGRLVAQKVRFPNKDFLILGNPDEMGLYGMHLWKDGGKKVVVTEGEIDALSVSQVQDLKWPVVSIPNGAPAAKKAISKNLDWLEKFDEVVFMFDMDQPGLEAAKECAELLTPGKAKIASLPLKDANECLKEGRGSDIIKAMWDARVHRPDGIVAGTEVYDEWTKEEANDGLPFRQSKLQALTKGWRKGELLVLAAGTGVGKTEVMGQFAYDLLMNHNETVGLMHFEEPVKRTVDRFVGLRLGRRVHIDRAEIPQEDLKRAFEETVGNGRVYIYKHFGSTDPENVYNRLRYFARGCGVTTAIVDHVSIMVSGIEDGDERRIIDNILTELATLAQELNIRIGLITHLKKPEGTPHEEGGKVSLDDFRGSGAIKQLAHTAIGLERNQQSEAGKHYTHLRLLKCRWTGETGDAGWLRFNQQTGWLEEDIFGPPKDEGDSPSNEDF